MLYCLAVAALAGFFQTAGAAVEGVVVNATTGQPVPRAPLTLIKFVGGMSPVEEVYSGPDGRFSFEKPLPESGNQPMRGMIRAEFEGVSYSEMIRTDQPTEDIRITVYSTESREKPAPQQHIVIFEPGSGEMIVTETFIFFNQSDPPRTFRDAERGTLRFYLPPEAKGVVQVSTIGPAQMPLRGTAMRADEEDVYMVDFPIKPGENRIDLTYLVPYAGSTVFEGRVLYPGLKTRMAAPVGVTLEGDGLESLGQEPRTQATLYETAAADAFKVAILGQGRLSAASGEPPAASGEGGGSLRVAPAPIAKEMIWVVVLTCAILAIGFYNLLTSKAAAEPSSAAETKAKPGLKRAGAPSAEPVQDTQQGP